MNKFRNESNAIEMPDAHSDLQNISPSTPPRYGDCSGKAQGPPYKLDDYVSRLKEWSEGCLL